MAKRLVLGALFLLLSLVAAFGTNASYARPMDAASVNAPPRQTGGQHFLTLPFTDSRIVVQQGYIYDWGSEHGGIDFVLGQRDSGRWQSFDVVAAADGWACANCTSRQGNAVWIKHVVNGITYYSYYGHLDTIDPSIPVGNQRQTVWVQRGQKIGTSGSTGVAQGAIHLHFQVDNASSQPLDPYDLWTTREPYAPGCDACQMGDNYLWTTNPPSMASGEPDGTPAPPPPTAPATTPVSFTSTPQPTYTPTATATPVSCVLDYGKAVKGVITDTSTEVKYCVNASAGDWISVRMFALEGSTLDTYLKLYGPDGKLIATDDDGAQLDSNSFLVQKVTQTGTYSLVATRFSGVGAYRIRLDKGAMSSLGDLNGDCKVDGTDIQLMIADLNARNLAGDLNLDGTVDSQDQQIQIYRLGRGCMFLK